MKHRPICFAAAFLLLLLICTAYNLSYHYITGNPPSAEKSADHESETIRSAPANAGNPHPVYQYYLTEEQGCVSIYLDDKETLYENTSIRLSSLPDALKTEIKNGPKKNFMIFWKITAVRKQVVNIKAHGLFLYMTAITVYSAESEDLPADHLLEVCGSHAPGYRQVLQDRYHRQQLPRIPPGSLRSYFRQTD